MYLSTASAHLDLGEMTLKTTQLFYSTVGVVNTMNMLWKAFKSLARATSKVPCSDSVSPSFDDRHLGYDIAFRIAGAHNRVP